LLVLLIGLLSVTSYADWRRFRGPNGSGVADEAETIPTEWSPEQNIAWKAALPGPGVSSPIVVGQHVFVTCYSGYGLDRENPGNLDSLQRHLLCFDLTSGALQWQRTVAAVQPEDPFSGAGVPSHGYASHTPVSDGQRVYAFFGKSGVHAFDLEGNPLWQASVGTASDEHRWGSSSSPILYDDLVIVTASAESRALVALDKATGQRVWKQEASGLGNVWGTPLLVQVDEERTDLVLGVPYELWGLNPQNGKLRWFSEAMETDQYSSSIVTKDGVVFGIEGRGGGSIALRVGGTDDVSEKNVLWSGNDSSRFGTPLVYQGKLYFFSNGVANAIAASDGQEVFQGRLPEAKANSRDPEPAEGERRGGRGRRRFGSIDFASPIAANGHVFYFKDDGTGYVLRAGDTFEVVSVNRTTNAGEHFGGTPAISDGRILVRSDKHLYCIAAE
jgi:outer membrane protein assembly factor BamB